FVLGITAVVIALIPIVGGLFVWAPAATGLGLAIAALVKRSPRRVLTYFGLALSVLSLIVATLVSILTVKAVGTVVDGLAETLNSAEPSLVEYRVSGDGGVITISSTGSDPSNPSTVQVPGNQLPWSATATPNTADDTIALGYDISAVGDENTTSLSCELLIDGISVAQQTAEGPGAIVDCLQPLTLSGN
ncbi:MAG: MmpS family transport accessory protein, partial [Agromyces sp.]